MAHLLVASFFSTVLSVSGAAAGEKPYGWLAYGDLRGYLEPCGCDPVSDLGGVKRIRSIIERERLQNGTFELFELGNVLPVPIANTNSNVKAGFLLEALSELRPDAALFNRLELQYERDLEAVLMQRPYYVLSNRVAKSFVRKTVETQSSIVLGYVSPEKELGLKRFDEAMQKQWEKWLRVEGSKKRVLLFSGAHEDLERIVRSKLFDVVIRSNNRPFSTDPDLKEKEDESLLYDAATETWAVPLGGQGILRGGRLLEKEALAFEDLVKDAGPCSGRNMTLGSSSAGCKDQVLPGLAEVKRLTWLPRSVGGEKYYQDLFASYSAHTRKIFEETAALRLKDLANSPYVGAESCKYCHPQAYKVWSQSSHASALATLKKDNKHTDWECVSCHVVGAEVKGGFVSEEASPHLANVQCETCHGPRKDHVANPTKSSTKTGAVACESCHHQPHSSAFQFSDYWEKIKHGRN